MIVTQYTVMIHKYDSDPIYSSRTLEVPTVHVGFLPKTKFGHCRYDFYPQSEVRTLYLLFLPSHAIKGLRSNLLLSLRVILRNILTTLHMTELKIFFCIIPN